MKIFFLLLFTSLTLLAKPEIEMEHTFTELEGSSWGTEDLLRKKLELNEKDIPPVFKTPLARPAPLQFTLQLRTDAVVPLRQLGIFMNNSVFLYRQLNICLDDRFSVQEPGFQQALDLFLQRVSAIKPSERPLQITILPISAKQIETKVNPSEFADCDVLAFQGYRDQFPFAQLQDQQRGLDHQTAFNAKVLPEMVLGLYYQFSKSSLPVIVFNPDLLIQFSSAQGTYVRPLPNQKFAVDGRALLFHELGHVLGFSHAQDTTLFSTNYVTTVMGLSGPMRADDQIGLRFLADLEIWKNWDLQQTSIYRSLLWKWKERDFQQMELNDFVPPFPGTDICLMPNEKFIFRFSGYNHNELLRNILDGKTYLLDSPIRRQKNGSLGLRWVYALPHDFRMTIMEIGSTQAQPVVIAEEFYQDHTDQFLPAVLARVADDALGLFRFSASIQNPKNLPFSYSRNMLLHATANPAECFK